MNLKLLSVLFSAFLLLAGCSGGSNIYYELPVEFRNPEKKMEFFKYYSKFLSGRKIYIDPGHGGSDRRSIGPQELVVEADANLNVALALRDYLLQAGALVEMSRDRDMTVDLKERSILVDRSGADIFVSIHHNAPGTKGDSWTNYTSTYYHAKETDYEYEPCERDLARFVQRDLAYAMRNSGGLGSFDGTYSDYMIYPKAGFSVLRLTKTPSILVECGFFTNFHEERRLADNEFNKIQAWGIFRGLARYFSAGIPEINFVNEYFNFVEGEQVFTFLLNDSVGIDTNSFKIQIDSIYTDYIITGDNPSLVTVNVADMKEGVHVVRAVVANKNGNYSFPFHREVIVSKKYTNN